MDNSKLVKDWVAYWEKKSHHGDEVNEADEVLDELIATKPLEALRAMFRISEATSNVNVLGMIGAGPLENFLQTDAGPTYVDEIIEHARKDKNWRVALGCVWTSGFKDKELALKVEKALTHYFPDGRL